MLCSNIKKRWDSIKILSLNMENGFRSGFLIKKLYYGRVTVLSVFGCISGGQSCFFIRASRKLIGWRPAKTDKKVTLPYIKYNLHWSWRWQWFWWLSDYDSFKILMSICNIYFLIYVKGLFSLYWWLLLCN